VSVISAVRTALVRTEVCRTRSPSRFRRPGARRRFWARIRLGRQIDVGPAGERFSSFQADCRVAGE